MKKTTDLLVDVLAAIDFSRDEVLSEDSPAFACIQAARNTLTYREREVLKLYNGVYDCRNYTFSEIGHIFGVSAAYAKRLIRDAQDGLVFAIKASKQPAAEANVPKKRSRKK